MRWGCRSPSSTAHSLVSTSSEPAFPEGKKGPARGSESEREGGKLWQVVECPFRKFGGRDKRQVSGRVKVGFLGET